MLFSLMHSFLASGEARHTPIRLDLSHSVERADVALG